LERQDEIWLISSGLVIWQIPDVRLYSALSPGTRGYSLFLISFNSTPPSSKVTHTLGSDGYAFTLNLVPVTFTSTPFKSTINGRFLSLATTKKPSSHNSTLRLNRPNFLGYRKRVSEFNCITVPSCRTTCTCSPQGTFNSAYSVAEKTPVLSARNQRDILRNKKGINTAVAISPRR